MTRISYILFALMIVGLSVSLYLYNQAKESSERYTVRVNTVKEVLLLLERTEKLKNILRKTIYDGADQQDTLIVFTAREKSEIDSVLNRLHTIVLYNDQRSRVDTMRHLVNSNYQLLQRPRPDVTYFRGISDIVNRARTYAEWRLKEQQASSENYKGRISLWANSILVISVMLCAIGIWSIVNENIAKRNLRNLHESILSSASVGVAVFETQQNKNNQLGLKLTFSNYGAVTKRNHTDEEVIISLASLPLQDHALAENFKLVLAKGKSMIREISYSFAGNVYWFITNISKVSSNSVVFYYQDITKIKLYENQLTFKLRELESVNKDLEQFAHATSHDLKEPFRKIQVMADMILTNQNADNQGKYLNAIIRASRKGALLVGQILNYSKVQFDKSTLERIDLNNIISRVTDDLDLVILENDATINFGKLPVVYGNTVQMVQLFYNLISNALKFTLKGKKPVIHIQCEEVQGAIVTELNPTLIYYHITIQDNGIGFDESSQVRIFNAFERLNNYDTYQGFGLGLSLCKKIVLNHEGAIKANSRPGEGSIFSIYLPKQVQH
jgi:signal transduction histidine kinase